MDISGVNVTDLIKIRNECTRYKQNLKTKSELYECFSFYNISKDLQYTNNDIEKVIKIIEEHLLEKCEHEWTQEWIDVSLDESKLVTYCKRCEITQN